MLDEKEFAEVNRLFREGIAATKEFRERSGLSIAQVPKKHLMQPMLDCYERLTGYKETNPDAVWHHRLSLYGPPCKPCGRPLRTRKAKLCGSCMFPAA